jgi:hypothetical protein
LQSMRTHVRSLQNARPMSFPFASWIVVAVALIVAETLVVYLLRWVAAGISGFSYVPPSMDFVASDPRGAAAPTIMLAVAVVICSVAAIELEAVAVEGMGRERR